MAVQVPSRLVVEWPLQASLEAGLPLLLLPNAQLAAGEKVEDGDGQLSCSNMMCIMLPPTSIVYTVQATSRVKLELHLFSAEPLGSFGQRNNHQPVGSVKKLAAV